MNSTTDNTLTNGEEPAAPEQWDRDGRPLAICAHPAYLEALRSRLSQACRDFEHYRHSVRKVAETTFAALARDTSLDETTRQELVSRFQLLLTNVQVLETLVPHAQKLALVKLGELESKADCQRGTHA